MSLVRIRRAAQITLPAEARMALRLREGDYLEAEVQSGAVLLRPVSVVDRAKAREELTSILARVQPTEVGADLGEDEALAVAVEEVKATRRELRAERQCESAGSDVSEA